MAVFKVGLVDVFASEPLGGNPLAIVEGGEGLDDATLRLVAREFNQAETTFIMPSDRADRRLRSFTAAGSEVFGAGHNALGAWLWLAARGAFGEFEEQLTLHQEIGDVVLPIVLERRDGRVLGRMRQSHLKLLPPLAEVATLAHGLGLSEADILRHPAPRPADTGAAHLLVRVDGSDAVDRAEPVHADLLPVLRDAGAEGCYIYAFDERDPSSAYARFFNPTVGLWEDGATGTAAGPLAAYLHSEGLIGLGDLVVEQGVRMGRRSLLRLRPGPTPELSGSGVVVMRGELEI